MSEQTPPKVGDRVEVDGTEFDVKEVWPTIKQAKRSAWSIRQAGGHCSYRKLGGKYCILTKVPPAVADYFFAGPETDEEHDPT